MASQQQEGDKGLGNDGDGDGDMESRYNAISSNEALLANVRAHVERERVAMTERNKNIKQQLEVCYTFDLFFTIQALAAALDAECDESKMTAADRQHKENMALGRDKFKTLKLIRAGNTKSRVAAFEEM
jgi:hypothetical protein